MSEVKLTDKGLEAFHSAIVESRKVADTMGAVRQAFSQMADSVAEYSALLELDKLQELDREIRQCTQQVATVSEQMRSAIDGMKEVAASTRQSFDIEALCQQSAGEWSELHARIDAACAALQNARGEADALSERAAAALSLVEQGQQELGGMASAVRQLEDDTRSEILTLQQETAAVRQAAQELSGLYRALTEEIRTSRSLLSELGSQREAWGRQQETEAAALEALLQQYQSVLDGQKQAGALLRQQRADDAKALQDLIDYYGLQVQEQKEVGAQLQSLLRDMGDIREQTRALLSLAETLRTPGEATLIHAYEGFLRWVEAQPARRKGFFARLKDLF